MDLIDSSDYNQPSKNRFASLKLKLKRTQSNKSLNKINQKAFTAKISRDFINCCDARNMMVPCMRYSGNMMMRWCNVLVFSVVVLIHIASINCIASRQIGGKFTYKNNFFLTFSLINWVEVYREEIIIAIPLPLRQLLC